MLTMPTRSSGEKLRDLVGQRIRADLGAQMQVVADAQRIFRDHGENLGSHTARIGFVARAHFRRLVLGADAKRVEDGGDAHAGELRIMGDDRVHMRPVDAGTRGHVALEIIRMQFDQSRRNEIALAVDGAGRVARTWIDRRDHAVAQDDAAGDHLPGENQAGIAEDGFVNGSLHGGISGSCCCRRLRRCR